MIGYILITSAITALIGYIIGGGRGLKIGYLQGAQDATVNFYVILNKTDRLTHEEKAKVGYALLEAELNKASLQESDVQEIG
jgi:hypothetical protein